MGNLKFSDGVEISPEGKIRVEFRKDGYYVVGEGMCCPVDSKAEGERLIAELREDAR
jgi:hypothetical protein